MSNNIRDLITKTIDEIVAITDGTTAANKSYMQGQLFGALKAIGTTSYNENYLTLSNSTDWPSFDDLQELLTSSIVTAPLATNLDLVINVKENVTGSVITTPRPYCYLYSNVPRFFSIELNTILPVESMYFSNLIISLASDITLDYCFFENCKFQNNQNIYIKSNCEFRNCLFENNNITSIDGTNCKIISSEVYPSGLITLDGFGELTFSKLNKEPIDNTTPITLNNFNIIL